MREHFFAERKPPGLCNLSNHATLLIQMNGVNILTDPIWSKRCSPFSFIGPKRHRPPGIRFDDLPPIDIVLVSHNHYDHLDVPTLRALASRFHPRILTPSAPTAQLHHARTPRANQSAHRPATTCSSWNLGRATPTKA